MTLGCFNVLHEQNVALIAHCFGLDIEKKIVTNLRLTESYYIVLVLQTEGEMIYEIFFSSLLFHMKLIFLK